jgi:hypothetical protein
MNHQKKLNEIKTRKNKFEKDKLIISTENSNTNKQNILFDSNYVHSTKNTKSDRPNKENFDSTLKFSIIQNSKAVYFLHIVK